MKRYQAAEMMIVMMMVIALIAGLIFLLSGSLIGEENSQQVSQSETTNKEDTPTQNIEKVLNEPIEAPIDIEPMKGIVSFFKSVLIGVGYLLGALVVLGVGLGTYFFVRYRKYKQRILYETQRCQRALDVKEQLETHFKKSKRLPAKEIKEIDVQTSKVASLLNQASKLSFVSFVKSRNSKEQIKKISSITDYIYTSLQSLETTVGNDYFKTEM